jgi:uncharacterized membrane protein HdeD (DUF308 family)
MTTHWTEDLHETGPAATRPVADVPPPAEIVRRARRWLLALGILSLLAGTGAILVPAVASVAMTTFVGWLLVLAGILGASHAFSVPAPTQRGYRVATAALALLVGIWLIAFPLSGTITLTFLLAVWFFGTGLLHTVAGVRFRGVPGAWLEVLQGGVSLILGILLVADLPSSAAWAIGLLVGINLIFWGARMLTAASLLRGFAR